ncbi:hypothetical protein, partial [Escherichia coli]|uniref:hypothetical protein n=1 Tax=Escherichia coli TaxID=562 RepID=UPI002118C30B
MGGIIFSFFTWGCVFAVLVDPEAKESASEFETKKGGGNRTRRSVSGSAGIQGGQREKSVA